MVEINKPKEKSVPNVAPLPGNALKRPVGENIQKVGSKKFAPWPAARPEPVEDIVGREKLKRLRIRLVGDEGVELGFKQIGKAVYHADNKGLEGMYKKKKYPRKTVSVRYKTIDDAIRALEEHMVGENYAVEFTELNDMLSHLYHLNTAIGAYGKRDNIISLEEKEDIKGRLIEFVRVLEKKHDLYKKVGGNKLEEAIDFLDKGGKFNINKASAVVWGARSRIERRRRELAPRSEWSLERVDALREIKRIEDQRLRIIRSKINKVTESLERVTKPYSKKRELLASVFEKLNNAIDVKIPPEKAHYISEGKVLAKRLVGHISSVCEQMEQAERYVKERDWHKVEVLLSNARQRIKSEIELMKRGPFFSASQRDFLLAVLEEAVALAVHHRRCSRMAPGILDCRQRIADGKYEDALTKLNLAGSIFNRMCQEESKDGRGRQTK